MNAQSNHPNNDTTDPQFLGPEAGQQAGGESHTRSEPNTNGSELHRYFSVTRGALISVTKVALWLVVGLLISQPARF